MTTNEDDSLLRWGSKQSHILTGGGIIESRSKPGVDFSDEHLPHYLLKNKIVKQTFRKWLVQNVRSRSIVGAWGRPLFSGGWMESTDGDTESFNLQTPSIFIDMRIPTARPTLRLRMRQQLSECSDYELRMLARQHCFSGYSFVEPKKVNGATVFTRHHIIDWNFHPAYPRNRPNRWWVETKPAAIDGNYVATESFKEFSVIRDQHNVPVYMERWARREPRRDQHVKYLAIRKVRTCPAILKEQGLPSEKDAVLVVVGQHWCLALDRDYTSLDLYMQHVEALKKQKKDFSPPATVGGGPVFVDNLLDDAGDKYGDYALRRKAAEDYVSLEGSYGILPDTLFLSPPAVGGLDRGICSGTTSTATSTTSGSGSGSITSSGISSSRGGAGASTTVTGNSGSNFVIQRSTQPWLEGCSLPLQDITLHFDSNTGVLKGIFSGATQGRLGGEWEVLECSFVKAEIEAMFGVAGHQGRLLSRL